MDRSLDIVLWAWMQKWSVWAGGQRGTGGWVGGCSELETVGVAASLVVLEVDGASGG